MIATVTNYPLARMIAGPKMRRGLALAQITAIEAAHGVNLGNTLREFYQITNGLTFFWRADRDLTPEVIDRYCAASSQPTTAIDWEMPHGIMIPPLETVLSEKTFGDLFVTERDDDTKLLWAGRMIDDATAAASVRVFDRYLFKGNEDGCVGLLMFSDAEPRIVGISDSGMIDPQRPWMRVETYLELIMAMGGEHGSRYELMGMSRLPPGEFVLTSEQIAQFGSDIFRPIS